MQASCRTPYLVIVLMQYPALCLSLHTVARVLTCYHQEHVQLPACQPT